uniref:Uncharacterized protein n=1 Tax=Arundo donax TaxID=35708 RepID=A0A0A9C790_ARUDO
MKMKTTRIKGVVFLVAARKLVHGYVP